LRVIDSDTINEYYDQLKAAEEKKASEKEKISQRKKGEKAKISGEEN
jgi:hypothetical protein